MITEEVKQGKLFELANLIVQYNAGERENINAKEFDKWELMFTMLKKANIAIDIYEDFLLNPTHYKIDNGLIVFNEKWEIEAEKAEQERIAKLHITKQDFFLYLCKPAGIQYEDLLGAVKGLNMQAEWDLCNHVYYGVIKPFLSALPLGKTEQEIIEIFEKYCKE